jgi:predicted small metal-binding protein
MAVSIRCADSGVNCPFEVKTEDAGELMEHVKVHVMKAHPELMNNPPSPEQVQAMIRKV